MDKLHLAYPRQVILVSSRALVKTRFSPRKELKENIFTLSWHMPVSFHPFLYAIAVSKDRFSYNIIKEAGVFAVNFMSINHSKEALFCGTHSGEIVNKFKDTKFTKEDCEKIDCVRLKEALAVYECEVIEEFTAGDHQIFIGKVLNSVHKKDGKRIFQAEGDSFVTTA